MAVGKQLDYKQRLQHFEYYHRVIEIWCWWRRAVLCAAVYCQYSESNFHSIYWRKVGLGVATAKL